MLGTGEIVAVGVLVLVLFGGKKLPQLGRGLAKGIQNFKQGLREGGDPDSREPKGPEVPDKLPGEE